MQCPDRWRAVAVASMTSCLVDVATTAPGAQKILGMMMDVVFPERVGPKTRALRCEPLQTQVEACFPSKIPLWGAINDEESVNEYMFATVATARGRA